MSPASSTTSDRRTVRNPRLLGLGLARWTAVVAAIAVCAWASASQGAAASPRVILRAGFDRGARLGSTSAMYTELTIDPRRLPSPATEVRMLYPKGLGLLTSGLGLVACTRPATDFKQVLIGGYGLGGCSPNAVLGSGTTRAEVRLLDGQVIPEYATLSVLSGPLEKNALGLVALVDGDHPFGAHLAYAGELRSGGAHFGGAMVFRTPAIPSIADLATVALEDMRLTIGSSTLVYYEYRGHRTIRYHPGGIRLPSRCPKGGFRFRVELTFQDGGHAAAGTAVRCPRVAVLGH
jgi:hypothetical protein